MGLEELRRRHSVPIFGMEPAVAKALDRDPDHRVLVIATNITCKGKMLQDQIARVDKKASWTRCPCRSWWNSPKP